MDTVDPKRKLIRSGPISIDVPLIFCGYYDLYPAHDGKRRKLIEVGGWCVGV